MNGPPVEKHPLAFRQFSTHARWVQPSLTPPTGCDPLGSRLSVVGWERDEDGGAAEAGVLMRVWRIYAWTGVVIDCAMTHWSRLADT